MAYFVTGATGFIGRHLVENLLRRGKPIHVLVRRGSRGRDRPTSQGEEVHAARLALLVEAGLTPTDSSQRSASMAARHPSPAAVTAWR